MSTVYAFCRKTDDIVDENSDSDEIKLINLINWKNDFEKALNGSSDNPLLEEVAAAIRKFSIPVEPFFDLIKGMEMDIRKNRYQTFEELELYCYRAASTVGLMSIEIFGYKDEKAKLFAVDLGKAMQLTNILRDVYTDSKIGRIYLPLEDLEKFNYTEEDVFNRVYNDNFYLIFLRYLISSFLIFIIFSLYISLVLISCFSRLKISVCSLLFSFSSSIVRYSVLSD